jgi:uncharacterized protein YkwD
MALSSVRVGGKRWLAPVVALAFCLAALGGCSTVAPSSERGEIITDPAREPVSVDPQEAARMVSAIRAQYGLNAVTVSAELNALAQDYADQLAAAGEITHDLTGTLRIRLTRAGYAFLMASENIGGGYRSIDEAFERWSASRTHLSNMLLPVTQVGIATGFNIRSPYRTFWVLILAYPG